MSEALENTRRMGGREARRRLRAAPVPQEDRAVQPGLSGGGYRPLSASDIRQIHEATLEVLETIGLSDAIPSCIEAVIAAGGSLNAEGRLLFPRALVEDTIAKAARDIVLCGQDPRHDMELRSERIYFGTAGAAVHIVDPRTREYRESTLADLYDIARLVDRLEHIHFMQRSIVCRDLVAPRDLDLNTCYASIRGTSKHVGTSWVEPSHVDESLEMLHIVAGSEALWRARPFVSMSSCFVVPPLRFAQDACRCLEAGVRGGMPVLLLAAGQAGATSPAALAGAVVQEMAEVLAGLVYVNAIVPGHPAILGPWPFVSDLRTGAMSGGSGEQAVLMAACGQMGRFYDLPTGIAAGMADSKLPDAQAGYEKGYTTALAGHCGANLVYESAGMLSSLLGACLESFVIDNDMLGAVNRTVRGVDVDAQSLSIEAMREVCIGGPCHFLGHHQTLDRMQRDYVYPEVGDRSSPKEWGEQGSSDIVERATLRIEELLKSHPEHISPEVDAQVRARFDIRLPVPGA
ncbi:trimethylamine methyltransferase family protein [Thioalkalivibrio sp. HK1]|uniref:trimethylamine methyltransferase family protein n=1 Tax=Thioalkalivibrio sp. HK1 TaxID=1469245 RepID=UPI00046F8BA2|nr:trimethylamine methyltransferase family protein [Thioalkalivibrio sp. HK1]